MQTANLTVGYVGQEPSVTKTLATLAVFVYPSVICKYDADLTKCLFDLYVWAGYIISSLDL